MSSSVLRAHKPTLSAIKIMKKVDSKNRHFRLALKSALAGSLAIALMSCGGDVTSTTDANSTSASAASASAKTAAALATFWGRYGAKESFTPMYVEVLTKLLEAEDKVFAADYKGARAIVDDLIAKYPLTDNNLSSASVWWSNYGTGYIKSPRPHLGEPGAYAHLRMLDDITKVGVKKTLTGNTPIRMAIVMPACSDTIDKTGKKLLNERLSQEIKDNSYEVVRQSLRLFQSYILAISGGELRLELDFHQVESCFQIKAETGYVFGNYNTPISQLPSEAIKKADMFWLIYPTDFDANLDVGGGSAIGGFEGGKPVFMSEDDWVIKKRAPDQGAGARTEVERRMYLPEWVQHEFFHHLFSSWPELGLEKTGHQWFDKKNWPADFVGKDEEDYYSEALNKRLYNVTPSIAVKLQKAGK
jgi:hypothetical protein